MNSGLLLVDKPAGVSSHDAVIGVRTALGTRKIGHSGTLDPLATGLLVMGINAGTRFLSFLVGLDKTYLARVRLGYGTATDDSEGELLSHSVADLEKCSNKMILESLGAFLGKIQQIPSAFSAVKVQGKRAYELARAGKKVELKARTVEIHSLHTEAIRRNQNYIDVDFSIECSSGTYIRAIARDLGDNLGVGGHLRSLRRTAVGPFRVEQALECSLASHKSIIPLGEAASKIMPAVSLDSGQVLDLRHGRPVSTEGWPREALVAAIDQKSLALVAVVDAEGPSSRVLMGVQGE